jgi:GAF domain-containing protein
VGRTGGVGAAPSPVGSRFELGGRNMSTLVLQTGRPARMDAYDDVTGTIGNTGATDWGFRSSVGVPISVEGRPWGLMLVAYTRTSRCRPTPRPGWPGSPSWSPPRSPTPRPG